MIDVAREAGVTRQAVSAVLNHADTCRISPPVQKKILEIAARLGYTPNITARILKGGSSGTVGVFTTEPRFGVSTMLINEVVAQLYRHGLNPQLKYIEYNRERMEHMTRDFEMRGVDGIIFFRPQDVPSAANVPHVTISNERHKDTVVGTDLFLGGFMATEHLIRHGRKRIAVLAERKDFCETSVRFAGWRAALDRYGVGYDPRLVLHGEKFDFDLDRLAKLLRELKVDAIFCKNDYIGGKIIYELLSRGIRVPDDIAVIGFDGMSFCDFCAVPLATVAQPTCQLAKTGVDLLVGLMKNKQNQYRGEQIFMPPLLMPNASCGCRPAQTSRFFRLNTYQSIALDRQENFGEDIFASADPVPQA